MGGLIDVTSSEKGHHKKHFSHKSFLKNMAYLVTIGFFSALLFLFFNENINTAARELLSMLIGMLASKWQTIIDFYYGASRNKEINK